MMKPEKCGSCGSTTMIIGEAQPIREHYRAVRNQGFRALIAEIMASKDLAA